MASRQAVGQRPGLGDERFHDVTRVGSLQERVEISARRIELAETQPNRNLDDGIDGNRRAHRAHLRDGRARIVIPLDSVPSHRERIHEPRQVRRETIRLSARRSAIRRFSGVAPGAFTTLRLAVLRSAGSSMSALAP